MAMTAVRTVMHLEEKKSIHPFFTKPQGEPLSEQPKDANESPSSTAIETSNYEQPAADANNLKPRKKRSRNSGGTSLHKTNDSNGGNQTSLEQFTSGTQNGKLAIHPGQQLQEDRLPPIQAETNEERRKRRKTASPGPSDTQHDGTHERASSCQPEQIQHENAANIESKIDANSDAVAVQGILSDLSGEKAEHNADATAVTPTKSQKRVLKVTKKGKLLSSPPTKSTPEQGNSPKRRRTRKTSKPKPPSTITIITYGGSDVTNRQLLGEKIDLILNGKKTVKSSPSSTSKATIKPKGPPKATHPFFLGKSAPVKDPDPSSDLKTIIPSPPPKGPRKTAVTPGKLRAEGYSLQSARHVPSFGPIAGDSHVPKFAGMKEALWPSKDTAHVRSIDDLEHSQIPRPECLETLRKGRKLKSHISNIAPAEDLISRLGCELRSILVDAKGSDILNQTKQHGHVRLPTRLLTTGVNIQERLCEELKTAPTNRFLNHHFNSIEHTLTPFDKGECEQQSWVQKYAPCSATQVLQAGKEAIVLRDWLRSLTVMSVESGKDAKEANTATVELRRHPKKKRKKAENDFIVDDFEDFAAEDMIEISDGEDYGGHSRPISQGKSVKQPQFTRDKNVVIISGPHGCGKSATVHAVAKELGFEVFEINSGSRRSGKDIQDRVGDMTANHLVNHKRQDGAPKQQTATADDTDAERNALALQNDIDSGRQGTMTSFFKGNPQIGVKLKSTVDKHKKRDSQAQTTLLPPKSQKQSLILFEEADVLFEEDQQFWAQVIKLASQSKRPIIITCNEEAQIPIYDLPLGAILRLSQPPSDLATDYMLTLAAKEGHIVKRQAISDLYRCKRQDLRASITELDFWCQMSVGDRKGGLEWIYQRWPPGKDIDEDGRPLRVASKDTYQAGMGWLSYDLMLSSDDIGFSVEEELLKEAWEDWGLSPEWRTASGPTAPMTTEISHLDELAQLDAMLESCSAADVYCRVGLPSYEQVIDEPINTSESRLWEKERASYTIDASLLQCDQANDYAAFDTRIFIQSRLAIQSLRGSKSQAVTDSEFNFNAAIAHHVQTSENTTSLDRSNFSQAFDILAESSPTTTSSYQLIASSFDRTFRIMAEDLAPFVRCIVAHELRSEGERVRRSNLLSEGGRSKRQRTTKASRTALEGGTRETKRRERWFDQDLNRSLVMGTAGQSWSGLGAIGEVSELEYSTSTPASVTSTPE
ncbi:P-loop containing nucleoside triphosphate hydrolase protein [Aaosphaeria arxii CBS 175.79]|uniref:P-loop containing nucleoside triphosphate hydrolase protein n=1 Tax=Aaosphaeria arxii CBS 175.79 TaxID=1450172 RepID=A0A6A5XEX3_9PLEO|nr:P-loop containing nucleoside triphosphate hydrolase protein [Aaosphaeria arxii CBS 175.79]KAF2011470.1 P-loop containing nucleoside triphosphate hydrolase protein [Aaosphaeria arxii CBS 175.79]